MTGAGPWPVTSRVRVCAGTAQPLVCTRPSADGAWLRRLLVGRSAARAPALLAAVFSLCAELHRVTAQRALAAARGVSTPALRQQRERRYVRAACLREHALQLALASARDDAQAARQFRGLPALGAFDEGDQSHAAVSGELARLCGFIEQRVLGMSAEHWVQRYGACDSDAVAQWAAQADERGPVAAWFRRRLEPASALSLELSPLSPLDHAGTTLPELARSLSADLHFAEHAELAGRPLATGAFNRATWPLAQRRCRHAYDLLAARTVDMVQLCRSEGWLSAGAVVLGPGEAIAYTEIARGLLVHWVKLRSVEPAIIADYRVLTPTDLCLHPDGALAQALRRPELTRGDIELLLSAFDPCVELSIAPRAPGENRKGALDA